MSYVNDRHGVPTLRIRNPPKEIDALKTIDDLQTIRGVFVLPLTKAGRVDFEVRVVAAEGIVLRIVGQAVEAGVLVQVIDVLKKRVFRFERRLPEIPPYAVTDR